MNNELLDFEPLEPFSHQLPVPNEDKQGTLDFYKEILTVFNHAEGTRRSGTFIINIMTRREWWSDGLYRLFGSEQIISLLDWFSLIHPDEREMTYNIYVESLQTNQDWALTE